MSSTIVIKIGSASLTNKQGKLDTTQLQRLAREISDISKTKKIVIVSSGAIVCGAEHMGLVEKSKSIPEKQAAAAIGQVRLMHQYKEVFNKFGRVVAQVLLTKDELSVRSRYLNARNTFASLFKHKVIPIVNENDTIATEEIKVGDNDNLAALVAGLVGAKLLINLTSVDGFYMDSPEGTRLVSEITKIDRKVVAAAKDSVAKRGTGGMKTKIKAAKICSKLGIRMVICNGRKKNLIKQIAGGALIGTTFYE